MSKGDRQRIDETTLRQLEILSLFLDSDPGIIDSMPIEEVESDLWELGVGANPYGNIPERAGEILEASKSRTTRKHTFEGKLVRQDLVLQQENLHDLFSR